MIWTIYNDHDYPKGGKCTTCVLLDNGCWTEQDNCNRRDQYHPDVAPIVLHKPRLFATKGGALNYKKTHLNSFDCYRVAKYTGPTDPKSRPVRRVYQDAA